MPDEVDDATTAEVKSAARRRRVTLETFADEPARPEGRADASHPSAARSTPPPGRTTRPSTNTKG